MESPKSWLNFAIGVSVIAIGFAGYYVISGDPTHEASNGLQSTRSSSTTPTGLPGAVSTKSISVTADNLEIQDPARKSGDLLSRCLSCLRMNSEDERHKAFFQLVDKMSKEDAPAIRDALLRLADQGIWHGFEWGVFWRKWGQVDHEEALAFLAKNTDRKWAGDAYANTVRSWTEAAPEAALQWLNDNASNPNFGDALIGFVDGRVATDSREATQVVLSKLDPNSPLAKRAMDRLVEGVFRASLSNGLANWFDELPRDGQGIDFRRLATGGVHQRLMQKDLQTAAAWTAAQSTTAWRVDRQIVDVAGKWAKQDPALAMEWAMSMTPSPNGGHVAGVGTIVKEWSSSNPTQLEAWLERVRGTKVFDQGARDYAIALARKDPPQANHWANQVVDAELKSDTLAIVARGGKPQQ
jgi:hypothetical protein